MIKKIYCQNVEQNLKWETKSDYVFTKIIGSANQHTKDGTEVALSFVTSKFYI